MNMKTFVRKKITMPIVKILRHGQITLPKEIRKETSWR